MKLSRTYRHACFPRAGLFKKQTAMGIALALALPGIWSHATDAPKALQLGIQAGFAIPAGDDLRITTGSALNPALGIHLTWEVGESYVLRPRLDLWRFTRGYQQALTPQPQEIRTKVSAWALGGDYLFRPGGYRGRWTVGAGLYLIRWSVESTNQLSFGEAGVARAAGTSRWTRVGFGPVATYRLSAHVEAEARFVFSRYGYEDLVANLGTVGFLYRF